MTKIRTSVQVEQKFIGEEPTWDRDVISVPRALSWYANQLSPKESKKFTLDYLKANKFDKDLIEKISSVSEDRFLNLGFVCRMIQRGAELDRKDWILKRISNLVKLVDEPQVVSQFAKKEETFTIQDRIFEQCSLYISEIDGFVDQWIKTKKSVEFSPYDWLISNMVKAVHAKQIAEHYKPLKEELLSAYNKTDEQLVEGYSLFKKTELRGFVEFISTIIDDCEKLINNAKVTRKPKKKKAIPAAKKVSKVKFKKEDTEYKVVSINPVDIIGASQLWIFNTKTKKLGIYMCIDGSGLSVKGSSIEGFDEHLSIQKTLRKPLDILPTVTKAKKTELKKIMGSINGKEFSLNGRINSDTILLKAIK